MSQPFFSGKFIGRHLAKAWNADVRPRSVCERCGKVMQSEEALASHYKKIHGVGVRWGGSVTGRRVVFPIIVKRKKEESAEPLPPPPEPSYIAV